MMYPSDCFLNYPSVMHVFKPTFLIHTESNNQSSMDESSVIQKLIHDSILDDLGIIYIHFKLSR